MIKYQLLFKNKTSKKTVKRHIDYLKMKFRENKKVLLLIDKLKKNPKVYTENIESKIADYEEIFKKNLDKSFLSIYSPKSTLMIIKKKVYDFAFNLQRVMSDNQI
jgi:hypothetical protein